MIPQEAIEIAYSFLHQKRNVYIHSTLSYGQIHNMEVLLLPSASFMVGAQPIRLEEMYLYP